MDNNTPDFTLKLATCISEGYIIIYKCTNNDIDKSIDIVISGYIIKNKNQV